MARRLLLLLFFLPAVLPALLGALEVPYLAGRVNDTAGLVPADARQRLDDKLRALEEKTGAQVAVLTVPTLEGDPLEDYSLRVVETWKLGKKGQDNGVLLLIVRDDRKMRLEVGYGLEAQLTDLQSRNILDGILRPAFRSGDFAGGIERAVDGIATVIEGGEISAPARPETSPGKPGLVLFFLFFFLILVPFAWQALISPGAGSWFVYLFLTPFLGIFPTVFLGSALAGGILAGAWLLLFPLLKLVFRKRFQNLSSRKSPWWATALGSGGGWSSRGGGGWGGFSGGGGGGGFSGGGGSFGGGGSSSSW
jgi:uncharacterized protein